MELWVSAIEGSRKIFYQQGKILPWPDSNPPRSWCDSVSSHHASLLLVSLWNGCDRTSSSRQQTWASASFPTYFTAPLQSLPLSSRTNPDLLFSTTQAALSYLCEAVQVDLFPPCRLASYGFPVSVSKPDWERLFSCLPFSYGILCFGAFFFCCLLFLFYPLAPAEDAVTLWNKFLCEIGKRSKCSLLYPPYKPGFIKSE